MRILILTAKDHLYANHLLREVIRRGILDDHDVAVMEQGTLISGRSSSGALFEYFRRAGIRFTLAQILRQWLFCLLRFLGLLLRNGRIPCQAWWISAPARWTRLKARRLNDRKTLSMIRDYKPDLILSLLSREKIPPEVFNMPPHGCLNLHPSKLPEYRGISPTFWCMAEGRATGGVSLHYVTGEFDRGRIVLQEGVPVAPRRTEHSFYMACLEAGLRLLERFMRSLEKGEPLAPVAVPRTAGFYRSIPTRSAARRFRRRGFSLFRVKELLRLDRG